MIMRIEAQADGKLRCYNFDPNDPILKTLEMTFNDISQMLIFFKNTWDKASRYETERVGNENVWRVYGLFELKTNDSLKELDAIWDEYTPSDRDLFEFRVFLKEKREQNQDANKLD